MDYSEKQGFLNTVYERFFSGVLEKRSGHARDCLHPAADRRLYGALGRRRSAEGIR